MARIFLILAVVFGLAAGVLSYLINDQRLDFRNKWNVTTDNLNKTTKKLNDTTTKLNDTTDKLESTTKNLEDTTTKLNQVTDDLTKAQAQAKELTDKVNDTMQKLQQAQQQATDLQTKLGAKSDEAQKAQAKVVELESNLRIRTDDLAAANAEVKRLLKVKEDALTGHMPPGVIGQVVSINTNWNFVVLNIGELQGVVPNGELLISGHNGAYKGKVRVANTEKNTCVADIILESLNTQNGAIQVGDTAGN